MFIITIGMVEVETKPTLKEAFKAFHSRIMDKAKTEGMTLQYLESTCWIQEVGHTPIFFDRLCVEARNQGWLEAGKLVI